MVSDAKPAWDKNNFLKTKMSLPAFMIIAIIIILIYCIFVSSGCATARRRSSSKVKVLGDVELAIINTNNTNNASEPQDEVVTVPSKARVQLKVKGVVAQIREIGKR